MGTLGEVGKLDVWGRKPTGGARMGDNGHISKRDRGVLGYRNRRGGVEGLCNSGELSVEAGGRLA